MHRCPCCGAELRVETRVELVGPPDLDFVRKVWPGKRQSGSVRNLGDGLKQGALLLRTKGPDHNWIERTPEDPSNPSPHRPDREHDLRPYDRSIDPKAARILAAAAELKARLENRATYNKGPSRPFRQASTRQLQNIINGID